MRPALAAGPYEDHWVCEYGARGETRWGRADAQFDRLQRHGSRFDCADLPGDAFVTAGRAWRLVRTGAAAPDMFGHGDAGPAALATCA